MVGGAEHVVEIHGAVKKAPGQVADHRAQEEVNRHRVTAAGPGYVREVFIAREAEAAERECPVAEIIYHVVSLRMPLPPLISGRSLSSAEPSGRQARPVAGSPRALPRETGTLRLWGGAPCVRAAPG